MGAYDYDWWPDTEVQFNIHDSDWQQLPTHIHIIIQTNRFRNILVNYRYTQAYGAALSEVEQSIEIQELIDFAVLMQEVLLLHI